MNLLNNLVINYCRICLRGRFSVFLRFLSEKLRIFINFRASKRTLIVKLRVICFHKVQILTVDPAVLVENLAYNYSSLAPFF